MNRLLSPSPRPASLIYAWCYAIPVQGAVGIPGEHVYELIDEVTYKGMALNQILKATQI